jgi:hypothetical protein
MAMGVEEAGQSGWPVPFTRAPPSDSWRVDSSEEDGGAAPCSCQRRGACGMRGAVLWRGAGCVCYLAKIFDARGLGISACCEMVEFCWSGNFRSKGIYCKKQKWNNSDTVFYGWVNAG